MLTRHRRPGRLARRLWLAAFMILVFLVVDADGRWIGLLSLPVAAAVYLWWYYRFDDRSSRSG